jgi:hypothetical protein
MENTNKLYTKTIDGVTYVKPKNEIINIKGDFQYLNPSEEMLLEDGWTPYEIIVAPEPEYVETIEDAKAKRIEELMNYDSSEFVNIFRYNGYPIWLDKATRVGLKLRIEAEKQAEKPTTTLWYNGVEFTIPIVVVEKMLYDLEVYASECYDNTQRHAAAINALTTIEDIHNYNFVTGYPHELYFTDDMFAYLLEQPEA